MPDIEALARVAVDCGLRVHRRLGPGLLAASIVEEGIATERQVPVSIDIDGVIFRDAFRADLVVGGALLIEVKSVEKLAPVHAKQMLTYLRLSNRPLGLLMNFGGATFKEGLKGVVNDYPAPYSASPRAAG